MKTLKELNKALENNIVEEKKAAQSMFTRKYEKQIEQFQEEIRKWRELSQKQFSEHKSLSEENVKLNDSLYNQKLHFDQEIEKLSKSIPKKVEKVNKEVQTNTPQENTINQSAQTEVLEMLDIGVQTLNIVKKETTSPQSKEDQVVTQPKNPPLQPEINSVENTFEFRIGSMSLDLQHFPNYSPLPVFADIEFFEHDAISTEPILLDRTISSTSVADFDDFQSIFPSVRMDNFFIYYLKTNPAVILNLNIARGIEYDHVGIW